MVALFPSEFVFFVTFRSYPVVENAFPRDIVYVVPATLI